MRQEYEYRGRIIPDRELVRARVGVVVLMLPDGSCVEPTPVHCPAGHRLRIDRIGWTPCHTDTRGGHRTSLCECGAEFCDPPLDEPVCKCQRR
ncbi:hypothetical protein [Nocardia puris]|uniref:hypothetical protein n=1 Tax=Nocardia puris TaxID=208602 RepID=UPI002E20D685